MVLRAASRLELATVLPGTTEGPAAGAAARETYLSLGATALVAQVDAALGRADEDTRSTPRAGTPSAAAESPVG